MGRPCCPAATWRGGINLPTVLVMVLAIAVRSPRGYLDGGPVALLLIGVLPFIPDEHRPAGVITLLVTELPSGSFVAASTLGCSMFPSRPPPFAGTYREDGIPVQLRDAGEFGRLAFPSLELVPQGVAPVAEWRSASVGLLPSSAEVSCYGAVALKR